jgi:hydrogenase-4 component B
VLPIGLPSLPFHFRLDSLSAFFLLIIGGASRRGCQHSPPAIFARAKERRPACWRFEYHLFLASMVLVVLADDAYVFMVMWETMALSSFFLVTANHRIIEIQRAGYLYLLVAHIGSISILLCFGVLQANTGDYTFANMRAQAAWRRCRRRSPSCSRSSVSAPRPAFCRYMCGSPEAHPAAPSPVSALMSGVMLKTAIYGVLRVLFRSPAHPGLVVGTIAPGARLGDRAVRRRIRCRTGGYETHARLLVNREHRSDVYGYRPGRAVFGLWHAANGVAGADGSALPRHQPRLLQEPALCRHRCCVLHATSERNLGKLGGLIRYMPWVAWLSLIGVLASAGLPPFGGFVSEWLLLQSFLFSPGLPSAFLNMLIPVVAALIALIAALAGYTMVKFFGIIFLGQPREEKLAQAHDASGWERIGMALAGRRLCRHWVCCQSS